MCKHSPTPCQDFPELLKNYSTAFNKLYYTRYLDRSQDYGTISLNQPLLDLIFFHTHTDAHSEREWGGERWVGDQGLACGVAWWSLQLFLPSVYLGLPCISKSRRVWNSKGSRLLVLHAIAIALLLNPFSRLFLVSPPLLSWSKSQSCFFAYFYFKFLGSWRFV